MPPADKVRKTLPPAVPAVEQVERQRPDKTGDYLSILDTRRVLSFAELIRFFLVHHYDYRLAWRHPFVLELQDEEIRQLIRLG